MYMLDEITSPLTCFIHLALVCHHTMYNKLSLNNPDKSTFTSFIFNVLCRRCTGFRSLKRWNKWPWVSPSIIHVMHTEQCSIHRFFLPHYLPHNHITSFISYVYSTVYAFVITVPACGLPLIPKYILDK